MCVFIVSCSYVTVTRKRIGAGRGGGGAGDRASAVLLGNSSSRFYRHTQDDVFIFRLCTVTSIQIHIISPIISNTSYNIPVSFSSPRCNLVGANHCF